ncbi:MAG TPA: hypothetical protein VNJ71_08440 [Gemmatimonadales bacterium]|jgi:hypothetical protein|nr:hypothetical protein [Gemmatimonadales bacterium]
MPAPFRGYLAATGLALALPAALAAQAGNLELGLDVGFDYRVNEPHVLTIGVPTQDFRLGFGLTDRISFEPRASLDYFKVEDSDAVYTLGLGAGLLAHFSSMRKGPYVRLFGGWNRVDVGSTDASQFSAGGGIGLKAGGGKVAARLEVAYTRAFENDDFDSTDNVTALVGFSVFTR